MHTIYPICFTVENTEFTIFIENNVLYTHRTLFSPPHIHSTHEMYIVLVGELIVNPKTEKSFYLSSNEGCVFLPISYHNSISVSDVTTKRLSIKFIFKKIKNPKNAIDLYSIFNYVFNHSNEIAKFHIEQNISHDIIAHSKDINNDFNIIILKNIFSLIFIKIAEQNQQAFYKYGASVSSITTDHISDNLESIIRLVQLDCYLELYANGKIGFSEIAKELFISTKQLSRIISEKFKKNPKNFFFEYKMKRAEFFLTQTDFPIKDISELIGYSSANTFTILFTKYNNMSPTEYRSNARLIKTTSEPKSRPKNLFTE